MIHNIASFLISQPPVIQAHKVLHSTYVTGPGKTGLIYTKYTCLYYGTYLLFCKFYLKFVNFIEFLMAFCIYDDILDMIQIPDKALLHCKFSKSGEILRVGKTCFPRPGHISCLNIHGRWHNITYYICSVLASSQGVTKSFFHNPFQLPQPLFTTNNSWM